MVIYLAGEVDEEARLDEMSPRQIVTELDKHVVGQRNAKRAVAIALRNRVRRQKLAPEMAVDVMPKNIIMIGSTGVGKTEIARRLARMSNSPFLKVEASKFTEVGYVGRDVESMIRDLTEISIEMTRQDKSEEIAEKAELNVEERILDLLLPPPRSNSGFYDFDADTNEEPSTELDTPARDEQFQRTREKLRTQLRSGKLDNRLVELEVREKNFPVIELAGPQGVKAIAIQADVSQLDQAERLVQETVEHFGRIDFLICNAGIWKGGGVESLSEELWNKTLDINLKGTWSVCRAAVPLMKQQRFGRIVIVSSTAGQRGEANVSNYAASKGGQIAFTKSLAPELGSFGISVNSVAPGWVETEMTADVFADPAQRESISKSIPLGRAATPEEIAGPIVFLCSKWADHITGEVLNVNGGSVLCG